MYKNYDEAEVMGRFVAIFVLFIVALVLLCVCAKGCMAGEGNPEFQIESAYDEFEPLAFEINVLDEGDDEASILLSNDGYLSFNVNDNEVLRMTKEGDFIIDGDKVRNSRRIKREVIEFIQNFNELMGE